MSTITQKVAISQIEQTLANHPAVSFVKIVEIGGATDHLGAFVELRPTEDDAGTDRVRQWRLTWDYTYAGGERDDEPVTTGWRNSYTGQLFDVAELRVWLDGTLQGLVARRPRRILELGCGNGNILCELAPHAQRYVGMDLSARALRSLGARLPAWSLGSCAVELVHGPAHDLSVAAAESLDAVVLNSVVQYFPSLAYLGDVLDGAIARVADGGCVFIGDVRSLPLLRAFHASLAAARGAASTPQLRAATARGVARERELVIDPAFFHALAARQQRPCRAEVTLKRGRVGKNELVDFRYDVTLHVGDGPRATDAVEVAWTTLEALRARLSERAPRVWVRGIANARLREEAMLLARIAQTAENNEHAVHPEDVRDLAAELGYAASLTWSATGGPGGFDAWLTRDGTPLPSSTAPPSAVAPIFGSMFSNDPLRASRLAAIEPALRELVEAQAGPLPTLRFLLRDELVYLPDGTVDADALATVAADEDE